jgi:hypothetical protein
VTFAVALAIAVSFWGARDVTVPPITPTPKTYEEMPLTDPVNRAVAAYDARRHEVWISPELAEYRREEPGYYCAVIIHEAGHAGGLAHSPTGVMSFDQPLNPGDRKTWPFVCRQVTKQLRTPTTTVNEPLTANFDH